MIASSALGGVLSVLRFAQEAQHAVSTRASSVASGGAPSSPVTGPSAAPITTSGGDDWERGHAGCNQCLQPIAQGAVLHCMTCGDCDLCARCGHEAIEANPAFHAPEHQWVIYVFPSKRLQDGGYVGSGGATAAAVMTTGGEFHCTGYYEVEHALTSMTLTARFLAGGGGFQTDREVDAAGTFRITRSEVSDGGVRVRFHKAYDYHVVEYDGVMIQGGRRLVGTWTIPGDHSGTFMLALEPTATSGYPPIERATWSGHYVACDRQCPTSMTLELLATGRITGRGRDPSGTFTVSGGFLQSADVGQQGHFLLTKAYACHGVSYDGWREGTILLGNYESNEGGRDSFLLEKGKYLVEEHS